MLIDAVHPEETRVALVTDGSVDDFDFEAAGKRQLRGNIYLAKVTRVEPSLQAAFVEYGGNRQGFLAFSEIHPDYYQLPQEDREALLREEAELAAAEAEDDEVDDPADVEDDDLDVPDDVAEGDELDASDASPDDETSEDADTEASEPEEVDTDAEEEASEEEETVDADAADAEEDAAPKSKRTKGKKAAPEKRKSRRRSHPSRRYKIQEVIRRRQVMLIQVVKEERGNKGAALTTYLSLAGRYCVLMPNTPRGGGISRKISNASDRKRLKAITNELSVPQGMGLIVRTAGAKRTKTDIKRDFNYLQNLWDTIREKTLTSMAPSMINEEGGLVHRAMRDLYDKGVQEVLIQGPAAYREAKDLARILMPSQAKKVKQWKSPAPLFVSKRIEEQLDTIFSPVVTLKSGGYLVINQTEALVAIDVNSGKSTRGRNIEQTATQTNTEAAEEACRQMRLRDLAGLIVIDFIDMDENKNNRAVEKKMRDSLALDRARVQNGRISQFGLMEISRQRRRTGVYESSSTTCGSCDGTGRQRSIESAALQLLRAIEARAAGGNLVSLSVDAPGDVALYLLNHKRDAFNEIEEEAGLAISISSSESMLPGDFKIDAKKGSKNKRSRKPKPIIEGDPDDAEFAAAIEAQDKEDGDVAEIDETTEEAPRSRRRGRRGGRRRKPDFEDSDTAKAAAEATAAALALPPLDAASPPTGKNAPPEDGGAYLDGLTMQMAEVLDEGLTDVAPPRNNAQPAGEDGDEDKPKRKRRSRRGRRGGRRRSRDTEATTEEGSAENVSEAEDGAKPATEQTPETVEAAVDASAESGSEPVEKKKPRRRRSRSRKPKDTSSEAATSEAASADTSAAKPVEAKPEKAPEPAKPAPAEAKSDTPDAEAKPKKRGWWARKKA